MKPTDNVCPSHAIVYRCLATSASPRHDIFSTKFSLKRGSAVFFSIISFDSCIRIARGQWHSSCQVELSCRTEPEAQAARLCLSLSACVLKSHFKRACIGLFKQSLLFKLSKSEKRFVRTHWLQASRRSCEWGLFYLLVSVSFDSEDLKRLRTHGRRPVRKWPTGIWRALNYPEIECM